MPLRVVVVGAGIVGAAVACSLARRGAAVTVLEQAAPASGTTARSFAWIGDNGHGPAAVLQHGALREYRRLEAEVAGVRVRWTGSLSWTDGPAAPGGPGSGPEPGVLLGRGEIAALEPNLRTVPEQAVHAPGDGALDPVAVTRALLRAARGHGAEIRRGTVTALRCRGGRVLGVAGPAGPVPADAVVLAAGTGVPALCSPLGIDLPVEPSPAWLVRLRGPRSLVRTVVAAPGMQVRDGGDGHLLVTVPSDPGGTPAEAGQRALTRLRSAFRGAERVTLEGAGVGVRPVPGDGVSIVGPLPGVAGAYVAVAWPGVQLAAVVGRLAAEEVVGGGAAPELRACRPSRFTATAGR